MKVGDLVAWGSSDLGVVLDIGTDDGDGLAYVEWVMVPAHSGYIHIEEDELEVVRCLNF